MNSLNLYIGNVEFYISDSFFRCLFLTANRNSPSKGHLLPLWKAAFLGSLMPRISHHESFLIGRVRKNEKYDN